MPSAAAADGSTLKFSAPALVAPVGGDRAEDRRPTLIWANARSKYGNIGVAYDIEVSTEAATVYERTVGESANSGAHLVEFETEFDTKYFWRMRAHVENEYGPWSNYAEFLSPKRPVPTGFSFAPGTAACTAPLSPMGPGETRKPRPNHSAVVRGIANAFPTLLGRSCQHDGGTWEFMDRSVDALRSIDGRYGYNAKRGNMNDPSVDVVSYFYANHTEFQGSDRVYIFDLIGGHCGPSPSITWTDLTDITFSSGTVGRTMYPRPGRNVTETPCE